ncbi:MAG: hydantoinase B/oxoprolinase family protein [Gammaproteobacteria bacterium]|nr:hydantoinase B/oxoprolinase family protein [Gammaproteobacteria bacterium]
MNPVELSLFAGRMAAVCEEMGAVLRRTAFSPNIKDRLDFSCAVFDAAGELCAQAAHIPVHLGSMAYAMRDVVGGLEWRPGDMVILNDPFLGGTHLPDVTLIAPVFAGAGAERPAGFVANRAHHADIGAVTPGSMPISGRLEEEGMILPPTFILRGGEIDVAVMERITAVTRNSLQNRGDFAAQISANRCGLARLESLVSRLGVEAYRDALRALNDYAERLARAGLGAIPDGEYRFRDVLDDDGRGTRDIPLALTLRVAGSDIEADFTGTAPQVAGNVNCPLAVTAAAVYYAFRCLMPPEIPDCLGSFRPLRLIVPEGSVLNARRPAAVAAGNVETSTRVVDVVLGALAQAVPERIPAASHGSMNNIAMGGRSGARAWDYYETLGGGMGAGPAGGGLDGVQTHMTNTLNTPIESLELHYPLRIRRYELRAGSGGTGRRRGGDGLVREYELLEPATVTLITERRTHAPWGLAGGSPGVCGENRHNGGLLPAKVCFEAAAGDRVRIESAGGGGWGAQD